MKTASEWQRTIALATAVLVLGAASPARAGSPADRLINYETRLAEEPAPVPTPLVQGPKDPFTAAVFSALFPGAGQLYLGQFWPKTVAILGGELLGLTAVILGDQTYSFAVSRGHSDQQNYSFGFYLGLATMAAIYIFSIIDAYTAAEDMNKRLGQENRARTLGEWPLRPLDNETMGLKWGIDL